METMLVAVFDEESKAYEGLRALKQLDKEGSIVVYAARVIEKQLDGTIAIKHTDFEFPIHAIGGTAIGAIIGLFGAGSLGMVGGAAVAAVAGGLAGSLADFNRAEVSAEFLDEVYAALKPGKFGVIADLSEDWVTPVNTQMEALGASVIRTARRSFEAEQNAKQLSNLRAEIERTKAQLVRAHANRKVKLQARIEERNTQLQSQLDQIKHRLEQIKSDTETRVQALQAKAENARADHKASFDARLEQLLRDDRENQAKLMQLLAESGAELHIHEREIQGIRILDLWGHIAIGASEARLREKVGALAQSGAVNVILNCAYVKQIDEDGLECLAWCSAKLREAGGALKLLNVGWDHVDLAKRAGLDKDFDVFSDEISALNSFFPERAIKPFDVLEYAKQQRKQPSNGLT